MPKKLTLIHHFSVEELEQYYKGCKDPIEKIRWQLIWLFARGKKVAEVSDIIGYSELSTRKIIHRYNDLGAEGLRDLRHDNEGGEPLLDALQQERLKKAIKKGREDGGLWNGPKVATWMSEELQRDVKPQQGWLYLKRLGFVTRRPRRRHVEADEAEQESFSKLKRSQKE